MLSSTHSTSCFRLVLLVLLSGWLLLAHTGCHRYHISDPKGPPQPKVKKSTAVASTADQSADDGGSQDKAEAAPPQHNSYDKQGLLKKKKYERRRRKRKVGQYRFMGIIF